MGNSANTLLVYPMLAQSILIVLIGFWLGMSRVAAVMSGRVKMQDISLAGDGWPDKIQKIGNNFNNQFQVPIVFMMICLLVMQNNLTDTVFIRLAWAFVALRVLHTLIHTTYNNVSHRFFVFVAGVLVQLGMIIYFALRFTNAI